MSTTLEKETEKNTNAIGLIQKDLSYMSKAIDETNKSIKEINGSIKEVKDNIAIGFVSIEQFRHLQLEVRELQNLRDWATRIVLGAIILAVLAVVGIGIGN